MMKRAQSKNNPKNEHHKQFDAPVLELIGKCVFAVVNNLVAANEDPKKHDVIGLAIAEMTKGIEEQNKFLLHLQKVQNAISQNLNRFKAKAQKDAQQASGTDSTNDERLMQAILQTQLDRLESEINSKTSENSVV